MVAGDRVGILHLLWPIVIFACRARGVGASRVAGWAAVAAVALYLGSLPLEDFMFDFGPFARFAEVLVGAALALHFQGNGAPRIGRGNGVAGALALGAIVGYALIGPGAMTDGYRFVGMPVVVLATAVLIHAGYGHPQSPVARLLSLGPLAAIGRYSYSLYLWHAVPLVLLDKDVMALPTWALGLIGVSSTAILTIVSYRVLERPFQRPRSDVLAPGRLTSSASLEMATTR